jgi:hypothetical protein
MTLSGLAVLSVSLLLQEKELFYDGPKDATPGLVQKAAKALAARCDASDIKDVTAAPTLPDAEGNQRIRLTRPGGFSEGARDQIDFLASFPASKVELRFVHRLSSADEKKFPAGKAAPPGDSWVEVRTWQRVSASFERFASSEETQFWLLKDKPVLDVSGKFNVIRHAGGKFKGRDGLDAAVYLEFPKEFAKTIYTSVTKNPEEPNKDLLVIALFVDGLCLETGDGMMCWIEKAGEKNAKTPELALWRIQAMQESAALPVLLKHPLPFALARVE